MHHHKVLPTRHIYILFIQRKNLNPNIWILWLFALMSSYDPTHPDLNQNNDGPSSCVSKFGPDLMLRDSADSSWPMNARVITAGAQCISNNPGLIWQRPQRGIAVPPCLSNSTGAAGSLSKCQPGHGAYSYLASPVVFTFPWAPVRMTVTPVYGPTGICVAGDAAI